MCKVCRPANKKQENVCCGTCKYHRFAEVSENVKDWICTNPDSDLNGVDTEYDYVCFDWRDRWT